MKTYNVPRSIKLTAPILWFAVYLWILDIVGVDVWVAHTIGRFIGMIIEVT